MLGSATSDAPLQRTQATPLLLTELERLHNVSENDEDGWKDFSVVRCFLQSMHEHGGVMHSMLSRSLLIKLTVRFTM